MTQAPLATRAADLVRNNRALTLSTIAFTVCFAVWTIFSIIGVSLKDQLGLSETQFGLLVGTPVLTGSLVRMVLGIWTDRKGGRLVYTLTMLAAAVATFLLAFAQTYEQLLLAALGVGLAGGSFAVGVAYGSPTREVARWLKKAAEEHGQVLQRPEPFVWFVDFGDNALQFELHYWIQIRVISERRRIESDLRFIIDQYFRDAGLVIAYPQRDLHINTQQPLQVSLLPPHELAATDTPAEAA